MIILLIIFIISIIALILACITLGKNNRENYDKPKIRMITYGNDKFKNSKKRLVKEALDSKFFDSAKAYGLEDLSPEFSKKFEDILKKPRGGGYWIWKFDIILKELEKLNENDFLIYLDAGCTINKKGEKRFNEYLKLLGDSKFGIISFQTTHAERVYTTKQIFDYFNIDINSNIAKSGQVLATVLIMQKNQHLYKILNTAMNILNDDPLLYTDSYNDKEPHAYFKDNRHEQSILSCLRKIHGSLKMPDECWGFAWHAEDPNYYNDVTLENNKAFVESPHGPGHPPRPKWGEGNSVKYPFWATRIRN